MTADPIDPVVGVVVPLTATEAETGPEPAAEPMAAAAKTSGTCGDNLTWTLSGTTLTIKWCRLRNGDSQLLSLRS